MLYSTNRWDSTNTENKKEVGIFKERWQKVHISQFTPFKPYFFLIFPKVSKHSVKRPNRCECLFLVSWILKNLRKNSSVEKFHTNSNIYISFFFKRSALDTKVAIQKLKDVILNQATLAFVFSLTSLIVAFL